MSAESTENRQCSEVRASVIIPTRGGRDRLHYPLDALRDQTRQDFEVIVVVDGDIDETESHLQGLAKSGFSQLRWILFPENRGRSAALNAGFDAARGGILIRCDDDLQPKPDYIEAHLRAHEGDYERGVIGLYDNRLPDTQYARSYGRAANRSFAETAYATPADGQWRYWAGNCSISRAAYQRIGGYDPDFRKYGWEDVDYGYRLHAAGVEVVIDRDLETPHFVAATTTRIRVLRALHAGAARSLFTAKHGEGAIGGSERASGLWGGLVEAVSWILTERIAEFLSRGVDLILPIAPHWLGHKLVSLLVEAASRSGIRHPERVSATF